MGNLKTLRELKPKEEGNVKKVSADGLLRKRLLDMGIVPGVRVEVVKVAPLGDPIEIKVKGYFLSLRKEEAAQILIEA